ncbi:MAG TPA: hypothetical protein P5248_12355, partial [Bacteroidales bacterium]|nr:hypothetical protein [Bacteroidales bacterium]
MKKALLLLTQRSLSLLMILMLPALFLATPTVVSSQVDLAVIEIVSPANCDLATNQATVSINIKNLSAASVSNFPVSFSKNSGTPVTETVT